MFDHKGLLTHDSAFGGHFAQHSPIADEKRQPTD
jgi:hypothetical protein